MSNKLCDFCGTINDSHHSAACVDNKKQSDGWHESHKQAIVEKWTQRPDSSKYNGDGSLSDFHCDTDDYIDKIEQQLLEAQATAMELGDQKQILDKMINHNETELTEALGEIKGLRRLVDDCHIVAGQLETERNEARAEIERLNKNTRFATAINLAMQEAGQDLPDLRGHECLAKHKLLSLFDFWHKRVRPRLPVIIDDEISRRDKLIEQMLETLELINGISSSLPSFFFDAGEDKDGNECESIYECVCAAIKAAKSGK